jgi:nucleotide sugar dehydrogenase
MNKTKIAVIGLGFVGGAIYDSFKNLQLVVELVGIDPAKGFNTPLSEIKDFDGVFLCVPSPQSETGECDSRIFESVLDDLDRADFMGVIISKVTAPPNVYIAAQEKYINLVHAPEFLTAANAIEDYLHGKFAIIGGKVSAYRNEAERLIRLSQPKLETVKHCSIAEASLAKYTINSFLATKVVFMNEMAKLTESSGGDWNVVRDLINSDRRIGSSHTQVPGPDGQYGFGGHCFPKDTNALLKYAESKNLNLSVLDAAVKKNLIIRLTEPK